MITKGYIRYIVEGYNSSNVKNVKFPLKNSFKLDADVIVKSKHKVSIS